MASPSQVMYSIAHRHTAHSEIVAVESGGCEVEGNGFAVIVREVGTNNTFIGVLCEFPSGAAMLFVSEQPLHFIMAWRGVQMLAKLKRLRLYSGSSITLNALTYALLRGRKAGLMRGLSEDFDMTFASFVVFIHDWRVKWLTPEQLLGL